MRTNVRLTLHHFVYETALNGCTDAAFPNNFQAAVAIPNFMWCMISLVWGIRPLHGKHIKTTARK